MMPRDRSDGLGFLYLALAASVLGLVFGLMMVTQWLRSNAIPIWLASLGTLLFIANGPIGKAIGRRIGGESPGTTPPQIPEELYAELDDLRARMAEVEERQAFAERLIASRADGVIPGAGGES